MPHYRHHSLASLLPLVSGILATTLAAAEPMSPFRVDPSLLGKTPPSKATIEKPVEKPAEKPAPVPPMAAAKPRPAPEIVVTAKPPASPGIATGYFLQFGAFADRNKADALAAKLKGKLGPMANRLQLKRSGDLNLVQAGPWPEAAKARQVALRVTRKHGIKPLVVRG